MSSVFAIDTRPNVAIHHLSKYETEFDFGHMPIEKMDSICAINGQDIGGQCDSWQEAAFELVNYLRADMRGTYVSVMLVGRKIVVEYVPEKRDKALEHFMLMLNSFGITSGYDHTKDGDLIAAMSQAH